MHRTYPALGLALIIAGLAGPGLAETDYRIGVLRVQTIGSMPISRLDLPPEDLGFAGAQLGIQDNASTGAFMGQNFSAETIAATPETAAAGLDQLLEAGIEWVVVMADATTTLALADQAGARAVILNAGSSEERLRGVDCRANMLHLSPSDQMIADALAQYLAWKRWDEWVLIHGSHPEDLALAEAYRRAAAKFGQTIVAEKVYEDTGGARRTDSGHIQVQKQMPVFTQGFPSHDVVVAADQAGVFADWLPWHTWEARPVAGSAGLVPTSWHPAQEAWGGTQFHTRFEKLAGRAARAEDFNAWMAMRVIGEAATRTNGGARAALEAHIRAPEFSLAAFKGQGLNFRDWDGQLRQPVLLASDNVVASVSPQEEFLHQFSQLDTLGTDRPETGCKF